MDGVTGRQARGNGAGGTSVPAAPEPAATVPEAQPRRGEMPCATAEEGPSLRGWMRQLETEGLLRRIRAEVDWDEEIAALARVNLAQRGPALLFENIRDHKDTVSRRFMTCGLATREQVALMAGLPRDTADRDLVRHFKRVYRDPVKPVMVETGPVKQNILTGGAIDVNQFPAPKWHRTDGGKVINTFCGIVTRDPETGHTNVGLYRGQVLGRDKVGALLVPSQGWGGHFGKYKAFAGRMPVAVVHGWHDALPFCAGSPFLKSVCEWDMVGAILGRPVELVKCETVDLEVPATAEVVFEGYIDPDPASFEMEGPYADYPGHVGGKASPKPVMELTAITHRDDPTMRGAIEGARPGFPSEDSPLCAYSWSAIAWNMLEDFGVDGVTDVWMPPVVTGASIVVQIRKRYRGHAQQVGNALWGSAAGQWFFKNVMVVEEDIDIRDREALDWAMAFRVDAGEGHVQTFGPTFGSALDPSVPRELRDVGRYGTGRWTRVLIDATRDWEEAPNPDWGGRRVAPINTLEPELVAKLRARWGEYNIGMPFLDADQQEALTLERLRKRFPDA